MIQANRQGTTAVIHAAIQVVVLLVQGAQAQQGAHGGNVSNDVPASNSGNGRGSDPFDKRLKAFSDAGVVKYTGNEGVLETIKWLDPTLLMVEQIDTITTERARRGLLTY